MRLIRAFALILVSVLFFQCQKEVSYVGTPDQPNLVTPDPLSARIQGTVLDENGQPAQGVSIRIGSQSATTDMRGYFRMNNATLDKKSSVVTAEKSGYFKAYRTFAATSGTNQVVIKLIKKTLVGTIDAATGGNVTLSNGAKVALPANGVVKASNNGAYTGTVNVYAAYIDPTAADISQIVPGSFMANNASGSRVTLASYGMMAVELESTSAEKLQIKSGAVATLTTPIPASLQGAAPQSIALWSVNEQTGIWDEEGTATKQGNVYVGDVKHFSFWNCDVPMNAVTLSMTIHNGAGNPLVYTQVKLTVASNPAANAYGYTDSLGQVSGFVPAGQPLVLELRDVCGNVFHTQNVGPFTQNTNLGTITVAAGNNSIVTVTGKLLDCSNNPVTNGHAVIYFAFQTVYAATDANGDFSATFVKCPSNTTLDVFGVDNGAQQQSTMSTVNITTPVTNVGNITACGTSSAQYINYTLDGNNYAIALPDSLDAWTYSQTAGQYITYIGGNKIPTGDNVSFNFTSAAEVPGTYTIANLGVQTFNQVTLSSGNVVITNFPTAPGQFYEGTFTAAFTSGGPHTLSGTFRIRK